MEKPLSQYQAEHRAWSEHNFGPNQPGKAGLALLGVMEELGELAHAFLKAEQGIRGTPEEHREAKIDAVADIVIFLLDFCNREEIDMATALYETWEKVRLRDWKADPVSGKAGGTR